MDDLIGQTIRGYEIRECISSGDYAIIYKGHHLEKSRDAALKRSHPQYADNTEVVQRFQYEAMIAFRLKEARVVELYDYWRDDIGPWLAMRWLAGGSLRDQIKKGPIPPKRMVQVIQQVAEGLNVAHKKSIVHRDIKPGNILLDEAGNAFITDFGIAKRLKAQTELTSMDMMVGSPAYLSPEQIQKWAITPRTDVYILGVTLYEALTGKHPFGDAPSKMHLILQHIRDPLPHVHTYNPALPEGVNTVIQIATAKDPNDRYPDILTFAEAFFHVV